VAAVSRRSLVRGGRGQESGRPTRPRRGIRREGRLEDDVVVLAIGTDFADAAALAADVRDVADLRFDSSLVVIPDEDLVAGITADVGRDALERDDLPAEPVAPESSVREGLAKFERGAALAFGAKGVGVDERQAGRVLV